MGTIIKPTVGRVVWYYAASGEEPLAAIIAKVNSDTNVNLGLFDRNGNVHGACDIPLVQSGEIAPKCSFCQWMPFQLGQAKKTEQAEADAAGKISKPGDAAQPGGPPVA